MGGIRCLYAARDDIQMAAPGYWAYAAVPRTAPGCVIASVIVGEGIWPASGGRSWSARARPKSRIVGVVGDAMRVDPTAGLRFE